MNAYYVHTVLVSVSKTILYFICFWGYILLAITMHPMFIYILQLYLSDLKETIFVT